MQNKNPAASVVIPTFNRKDCLRNAVTSCFNQTVPVEVIVMDDGSTDGTAEMMRTEFPQAIFETYPGPNGPCFLRNRGSALAAAPILFPIDDDAEFKSPETVEQTLKEFNHPRIGAVGIPYINVRVSNTVHQRSASGTKIEVMATYVGASHALRRDIFLRLGGYKPEMFYMGEEKDYSIRLLDAGYVVRAGRADPIYHYESPNRSSFRAAFHARKNDILFPLRYVPQPYLLPYLAVTTFNGIKFGFKVGTPIRMLRGVTAGWLSVLPELRNRKAVRRETYHLYRRLLKGYLDLEEVEPLLAPICDSFGCEHSMVVS